MASSRESRHFMNNQRPRKRQSKTTRASTERARKRLLDKRRASGWRRGYDGAWAKARAVHLQREPLCRFCREQGKVVAATVVDHIVPIAERPDLRLDHSNLRSLCKPCHDSRTAAEQGFNKQHGQARPDWLLKPRCAVTLVCGPPGSGKSSYVVDHAAHKDIVIDLDDIRSQVSGLPIYQSGKEWLGPALAARNSRLARLAAERASSRAWVIVSAPSAGQRKWWQDQLAADRVVLCDVPPAECKRRIRSDQRRAAVLDQHLLAVDEWWAIERGLQMPKALKRGCAADGTPTDPAHPWNA